MTDIQILEAIANNRMLFTQFMLIGTIMPIGVVFVAYMFRDFSTTIRGAAMISALIGVIFLAFFSASVQGVLFQLLSSMSQLASGGESVIATRVMASLQVPAGEVVSAPTWMNVLSIVQIVINLVLTVYVFLFAKWTAKS